MKTLNHHITLQILLESLNDDFDSAERLRIFEQLKNTEVTDEALLGATDFLETNNWDYMLLKNALNKTEHRIDTLSTSNNKVIFSKKSYLKYAALFIPIAMATYFSLKTSPSIDDYYVPDPGLPNLMSTTSQKQWNDLMELYKSNQFEKAFTYSTELEKAKTKNDTAIYFNAVLAYELKKYDLASADFKIVEEDKNSIFIYDAEFRLGFSLLKSGNKTEAKKQFEKIASKAESPFTDEAKVILDTFF